MSRISTTSRVSLGGHSISKKRIGLRSLRVVNQDDTHGLSMVFRVNGIDIFCKGANWIPSDALPQRESRGQLWPISWRARDWRT